jgi:phosphoglycerol transferase
MTTSTLERQAAISETVDRAPTPGRWRWVWQEAGLQLVGVVICLALVTWAMKLWETDLHIPFAYEGDAVLFHMLVKGVTENGWYLHNDALAAPSTMDLHDFPMADSVHFLWIVGLSKLTHDHALVFNLFYLLTFPLTTATAIWALRRLSISSLWALVFGLLYAFQPYHFLRGTGHYFLSAYYLLPPTIWAIVCIYQGRGPFLGAVHSAGAPWSRWLTVAAVAIASLTGGCGFYYAAFSGFFALVAGASASISLRRWTPLLNACLLTCVTAASMAAVLMPSILYRIEFGSNTAAFDRNAPMAEILGLKITQLVMPVPMHRIEKLRHLTEHFLEVAPLTNENSCSAMGMLASLGFGWLLARLLVRGRNAVRTDPIEGLTVLTGSAVFLGTVGGFGALASWLGVTWIRGYNRVSIFIAFCALAALGLFLDRWAARLSPTRGVKFGLTALAAVILSVGVFDQAGLSARPGYERTSKEYLEDEEFIRQFEASVPAGTMVFQLPYQRFVEHTPLLGMNCYDLLHPYLHSHQLRWSYGAVDGRTTHAWQKSLAKRPTRELVEELRNVGFGAIYIDRRGFAGKGAQLEKELKAELKTTPMVSTNERICIFPIKATE